LIVLVITGCAWFGSAEYPTKELIVEEPGGAEVHLDPGALDQRENVTIEDVGVGAPLEGAGPLTPASNEYVVEFGAADQIGGMTMTVPLKTSGKTSAPVSAGDRVYAAYAEPFNGTPSMVGAIVENGEATFPVVGAGKYQVYSILNHEALLQITSIFEPLAVPTYRQNTPAWCSPTAMTNLVQYHEGGWPAGGIGAVWGESSNYYLAGKASQPFDHGYFFHWLLDAGGYYAPADVKQSYSTADFQVVIWNWKAQVESGYTHPLYAEALFHYFQAYVEYFLWGGSGQRRPVAWGSSLAGHSRTITGSDGNVLYYNDPSSGSLNQTRSWEDYMNDIVTSTTAEKIEIIDTVVFHAPARPEAERKLVIWLYPYGTTGSTTNPGSVRLRSGVNDESLTNWYWDGSGGHSNGYYYEDISGKLESDPTFGVQFEAFHYHDYVDLDFQIRNITDEPQDFTVKMKIRSEDGSVDELFETGPWQIGPEKTEHVGNSELPFRIANKPPGVYTITIMVYQGSNLNDIKYVMFRLNEQDKIIIDPHGYVNKLAFCRFGPDPVFEPLAIVEEGTEVKLLGVNPERNWGLFEVEGELQPVRCWMGFGVVDLTNEDEVEVVEVPPMPIVTPKPKDSIFSCSDFTTEETCMAENRCEWKFTIGGPGFCAAK
jgi:hypothetical protein